MLLVLGLAGCAEPDNLASRSSGAANLPAEPSAAPPPETSPLMDEKNTRGAKEFAAYWFQTLNYAIQTGDVAPLVKASDTRCAACQDVIGTVQGSYSDGGYVLGGMYTVRSAVPESMSSDADPLLAVTYDRSPRSGMGPDGQVRDSVPALSFQSCQLILSWFAKGWRVSSVLGEGLPA